MTEVSPPTIGASGPAPPPTTESPKSTIDQGQGNAQQAKDKAGEVAGQAQEKAQQAAGQAKGRARQEVDRRSTEAGEQVSTTAQDLRSVGETLREQGKDTPARLADQAAERAERVGGYLKDSDADRILGDVEDLARRQPWAVAVGGIALGFAAARFLKASSSERYQQSRSQQGNGQASPSAGMGDHGYATEVRPTEGIGADGQRRFQPGTGGMPPAAPRTTTDSGATETPTSGVVPPAR